MPKIDTRCFLGTSFFGDVPSVEFICLVVIRMPGDRNYHGQLCCGVWRLSSAANLTLCISS